MHRAILSSRQAASRAVRNPTLALNTRRNVAQKTKAAISEEAASSAKPNAKSNSKAEGHSKSQTDANTGTNSSASSSSSSSSSWTSTFRQQSERIASKFTSATASSPAARKATASGTSLLKSIGGSVQDAKRSIIDENAYRYGGMTSKAFRKRIREQRVGVASGASESSGEGGRVVAEDPNAGANVTLHKDSKWKEAWDTFKDKNPVVQGVFTIGRRFEESDNALVNTARLLSDRLRDMFGTMVEETEHGQTIAALRESDPHFEVEHFLKDAREFMIPEVMEAFIEWQPAELKQWCSEGVFNVLEMSREQATQDGHVIEGRLLDLRNVELAMARMMEDIPLLILSFKTQQTEVVRDRVGEIVMGSPDTINNVVYVWALTKDAEKPNPLTKGWRIVEFAIQDVRESL